MFSHPLKAAAELSCTVCLRCAREVEGKSARITSHRPTERKTPARVKHHDLQTHRGQFSPISPTLASRCAARGHSLELNKSKPQNEDEVGGDAADVCLGGKTVSAKSTQTIINEYQHLRKRLLSEICFRSFWEHLASGETLQDTAVIFSFVKL